MISQSFPLEDYLMPDSQTMKEFFMNEESEEEKMKSIFFENMDGLDEAHAWEALSAESHYAFSR